MKFESIDSSVSYLFPHTIFWLQSFETSTLNKEKCEIVIRDTDHQYDSIRITVQSESGDYQKANKFRDEIYDYIRSHCCKCGSTQGVSCLGEDILFDTVCSKCAERLQIRDEDKEALLLFDLKYGKPHRRVKCRLKDRDGHLFYKFARELIYKDGQLFSRNGKSLEPVTLSGVDTGLRDSKDERIYTGDVLIAEDKDGRKFWGMIRFGHNWGESDMDISPKWSRFSLSHGTQSFPSALSWAKRIEIVGNVVKSVEYCGPIPSDEDYERYCKETNYQEPEFTI